MSVCKSCGAEIAWVQMSSKKMMPVDMEPTGTAIVLSLTGVKPDIGYQPRGHVVTTFKSHFETCPNAKEHLAP